MVSPGVLLCSLKPNLSPTLFKACAREWQQSHLDPTLADQLSRHKIWPTLEFCLRSNQLWSELAPELQERIHQARQVYSQRQIHILDQLEELDQSLAEVGRTGILLKGAALLFYPIYPSWGDRVTADIDILVDPSGLEDVKHVLFSLGYTQPNGEAVYPNLESFAHLAPFCREGKVQIEVHRRLGLPGVHSFMGEWIRESAQPIEGFHALRLPSITELVWHMVWHSWFNLAQARNLLDLHRIRLLYNPDWSVLSHRAEQLGVLPLWVNIIHQIDEFDSPLPSGFMMMQWGWIPSAFNSKHYQFMRLYPKPLWTLPKQAPAGIPPFLIRLVAFVWRLLRLISLWIEWCVARVQLHLWIRTVSA